MSRHTALVATLAALAALAPPAITGHPASVRVAPRPRASNESGARAVLARGGSSFVESRDRAGRAAFTLRTGRGTVSFTARGVEYASSGAPGAVAMEFANANPTMSLRGEGLCASRVSLFEGTPDRWRTGLSTYSSVHYRDVWPGVDLVFRISDARLKYEFVVAPGVDPGRIRLAWRGVTRVAADGAGRLEIEAPGGSLVDEAPVSCQQVDGRTALVATAWSVEHRDGVWHHGFRLGAYDRSRPLTIDPSVAFAGFLGGSRIDAILDAAAGPDGSVYVVGTTGSKQDSFPVTVGPDATFNPFQGSGLFDAFVAKISPDGELVYCGYIGGDLGQMATGVAVDAQGNAYVVGVTNSDAEFSHFPATVGPRLDFASDKTLDEGFIAKVSADGTRLLYCGYIGGELSDDATDVAVDAAGSAYVTGFTNSRRFPVAGGPMTTFKGDTDAFVAKVKADGTGFVYSGYLGGPGADQGLGIAVDGAGSAYVTGRTSSATGFPVSAGPQLAFGGGLTDAFIAKLEPDGTGLVYLGYIGGEEIDVGVRVAVDASGNAYVAGTTNSPETSFPVRGGPDLTYNGPAGDDTSDAFVAKVKPDGTAFVYLGYIGGAGTDAATSTAVGASGGAFVVGTTSSNQNTFPVVGNLDATFNGPAGTTDAFLAEVSADGTRLVSSGYLGGDGSDFGIAIAVAGSGDVYVAGATDSTETTYPVAGGLEQTARGSLDAFVAKIAGGPPAPRITAVRKEGKFLVVEGENFERGARVLVNGTAYKAKADAGNPSGLLKSKKAGKVVQPGDLVKVRNPDGRESNEFTFDG